MNRFRDFYRIVSKNNTKTCFVLKCDIRKFFASIDHKTLKDILNKHIQDEDTIWLLDQIIYSFHSYTPPMLLRSTSIGLPLGNLTSQLLVNIYMNEFDQFMKHNLKVKYYIRYADDFVILSDNREYLEEILKQMKEYLITKLKLNMHPDKVYIKTISSGLDFLGWVHFLNYRVLRTSTKRRMFKNLKVNNYKKESVVSYLGMLNGGNAYKLSIDIEN